MLAVAAMVLSIAGPAAARPKRRDARLAFDRGVTAYQKGNFEAASEALARSFAIERDVDTLFAWAQTERKLDHCDKAIELYEKLQAFDLPAANRQAVDVKLAECRADITARAPQPEPPPVEPPRVEPKAVPPPPPPPEPPPVVVSKPVVSRPPPPEPVVEAPRRRAWYKDPVTLTLLGTGVVATGTGTALLLSAQARDSESQHAGSYAEAQRLVDEAKSRGNLGLISTGVGGALLVGGVVWIAMHRGGTEHMVTGWLTPGGGGVGVAGAF